MSILLDALRKSENSHKPVEPPTIHGNDHQIQDSRTIKSSYVVLLIVVALIVIGWLLWQQYHSESGGYSPPVELPKGNSTSNVPAVPGKTKSAPPETAPAKSTATKTTGQKAARASDGRPRTPVEVFEETTRAYDEMTQEEKDAEKARRRTAAAEVRAQRAADKVAAENRQRRTPAKVANTQPANTNNNKSGLDGSEEDMAKQQASDNSDTSTERYRSPEPEPIGYWELPDSVRRGVPEIKFSVLVYADNPANRFVLVNGERLVEGQELKPGVEVEQIRRDGVVFSYQMYKFFVKR